MASDLEIKELRIQKVKEMRSLGINPYPSIVKKDISLHQAHSSFEDYQGKDIHLAGRVTAIRGQGAILFIVLYDGTAKFQVVLKRDDIPVQYFESFHKFVDIGDFISVTGTLFVTQRGEKSLLISQWQMASKSLLPLPEKWHGLQDDDERYRKRYLDIISSDETREMFYKKTQFWKSIRDFLEEKGFMEVHTPTLELTTGGAEAEPFATHHNDFDLDVYLRISVGELWQKRLMAAGFPKTYEIGRAYRNEGSSPNHLQEFTNIEFYWSFADYTLGRELVKELYQRVAREVFGKTEFSTRGHTFDLGGNWDTIVYTEEIQRQTGINVFTDDEEVILAKLVELGVKHDAETRERMVDVLWKYCRKNISGPAFVIGYPDFMQPLAKRDPNNARLVEQFQVLIGGAEIGKGYSELNDPIDQRERFERQQELTNKGDKEAMMADWEFVEMLEHGMPPTFGFGAGDRLFAFLVDKPIRETVLFPLMKPKLKE